MNLLKYNKWFQFIGIIFSFLNFSSHANNLCLITKAGITNEIALKHIPSLIKQKLCQKEQYNKIKDILFNGQNYQLSKTKSQFITASIITLSSTNNNLKDYIQLNYFDQFNQEYCQNSKAFLIADFFGNLDNFNQVNNYNNLCEADYFKKNEQYIAHFQNYSSDNKNLICEAYISSDAQTVHANVNWFKPESYQFNLNYQQEFNGTQTPEKNIYIDDLSNHNFSFEKEKNQLEVVFKGNEFESFADNYIFNNHIEHTCKLSIPAMVQRDINVLGDLIQISEQVNRTEQSHMLNLSLSGNLGSEIEYIKSFKLISDEKIKSSGDIKPKYEYALDPNKLIDLVGDDGEFFKNVKLFEAQFEQIMIGTKSVDGNTIYRRKIDTTYWGPNPNKTNLSSKEFWKKCRNISEVYGKKGEPKPVGKYLHSNQIFCPGNYDKLNEIGAIITKQKRLKMFIERYSTLTHIEVEVLYSDGQIVKVKSPLSNYLRRKTFNLSKLSKPLTL